MNPIDGADRAISYPTSRVIEETKVTDPFRWLEEKDSEEVKNWVEAQNGVALSYLENLPQQPALMERFKRLTSIDSVSVPKKTGGRLFYLRQRAGADQPALYWRTAVKGNERALIDPNGWDPKRHEAFGQWFPSPDGTKIAYAVHLNNSSLGKLRVIDVDSAKENPEEEMFWADYADLSWSADSQGFYYTRVPSDPSIPELERVGHADVGYHRIGTAAAADAAVYPPTNDSAKYLTPIVSDDGQWLFILISNGWTSSEIFYRKTAAAEANFKPLFVSTFAVGAVAAWKNHFYLTTNDGASNYRVTRATVGPNGLSSWETVVPERSGITINSTQIIGEKIVLNVSEHVASRLEVRSPTGRILREIRSPLPGAIDEIEGDPRFPEIYYQFESFTVPPEVRMVSVNSSTPTAWEKSTSPIDAGAFRTEQLAVHARDGASFNMYLIMGRNSVVNGNMPVLMQGYGGFNVSYSPRFDPSFIPLLEAGWAVAIPNVRGGGEYGEAWHRAGMGQNKRNTFSDFISAANFLIRNNYTRKGRLAVSGTSNGGLLAGAVMTQQPDLFRAVVLRVPVLDMIRFPKFGEGKTWVPEYGDPDNAEDFTVLYSYSPYHHVTTGTAYPSVLLISSENDDRVDPMHARKMTAALQKSTASGRPILLWTRLNAGHSGTGKTSDRAEEMATRSAFLLNELR